MYLRSVLTRRFQSELGASELDLVIRPIDTAIMVIPVTDTAIIHMDTTDPTGTTAIPEAPHTATGIVTTATIGITITTATKAT